MEFVRTTLTTDWKLRPTTHPQVILFKLEETLSTRWSNRKTWSSSAQIKIGTPKSSSNSTNSEIRKELENIISSCNAECDMCCTLIRQLSAHALGHHKGQGQGQPAGTSRKRKQAASPEDNHDFDSKVQLQENAELSKSKNKNNRRTSSRSKKKLVNYFDPDHEGEEEDTLSNDVSINVNVTNGSGCCDPSQGNGSTSKNFKVTLTSLKIEPTEEQVEEVCAIPVDLQNNEVNDLEEHAAESESESEDDPNFTPDDGEDRDGEGGSDSEVVEIIDNEKAKAKNQHVRVRNDQNSQNVTTASAAAEFVTSLELTPHSLNSNSVIDDAPNVNVQNFVCQIDGCGKKFNAQGILNVHVRLVHEKSRVTFEKELKKTEHEREGRKGQGQGQLTCTGKIRKRKRADLSNDADDADDQDSDLNVQLTENSNTSENNRRSSSRIKKSVSYFDLNNDVEENSCAEPEDDPDPNFTPDDGDGEDPIDDDDVGSDSEVEIIDNDNDNEKEAPISGKRIKNHSNGSKSRTSFPSYSCKFCPETFRFRRAYEGHFRADPTHQGKCAWECTRCGKEFVSHKYFKLHLRVHNGQTPNETEGSKNIAPETEGQGQGQSDKISASAAMCGICKAGFVTVLELTRHLKSVHGQAHNKFYNCHVCAGEFKFDFENLTQHFELFHPDELPLACSLCDKDDPKLTFALRCELDLHERMIHTKKRVFPCDKCPKVFLGSHHIKIHAKAHEKYGNRLLCPTCGNPFENEEELNSHCVIHTPNKNFVCQIEDCEKKFTAQEVLDAHVQLVHEKSMSFEEFLKKTAHDEKNHQIGGLYVCGICQHTFARATTLETHVHLKHGDKVINKFSCYICKLKLFSKKYLMEHMGTDHPEDPPHQCEICKKVFTSNHHFSNHMMIHARKNKPFECPICKIAYTHKSNLQAHINFHHLGEKPFKCARCNVSFASKSGFHSHKLTHGGNKSFMCDECGKCFGTKPGLSAHSIIHKTTADGAKLKAHACVHKGCNARFAMKEQLKTHSLIHSGVKSHMCEECGKCFRLPHQRRAHLKTHK